MERSDRLSFEQLTTLQKQTKDDVDFYSNLRLISLALQCWTVPAIGIALALSRRVVQDAFTSKSSTCCLRPSKSLCMPKNIASYRPDLNPINNLWRCLKSHLWFNRTYPNAESLEEAVVKAWKVSVMDNQLM